MHIAYVHQYFATPRGHTGTRSYEFARRWVAAGHRVTMLASTAQLVAEDVPGGDLSRRVEFDIAGIHVIALPVAYSQSMGRLRRLLAFVPFMCAGPMALLRVRNVALVYATSTPLTVGVPALLRRWLRATPFVFEVRDLWPEIPYQLGYLRSGLLMAVLRWFERRVYRSASLIVALSPGMRDGILAAAPQVRKVIVVPNCCDTETFRPDIDGIPERSRRGWNARFVCVHVGAVGMSNGLDQIIRLAKRVADDPEFLFVLVGDGRELAALRQSADELGLRNVQFLGHLPKIDVPAVLAAADVSLVTFAPFPILEHNSANKFFDSLSAGKPILVNYSGWQRELLESEGAGLGCAQGDEDALAENLRDLKADSDRRQLMARNARRVAESCFSRDRLADEVRVAMEEVGSVGRRGG